MRRVYPKRKRIHLIRMNEERILRFVRGAQGTTMGSAKAGTVEVHRAGKTLPEALAAGEIRYVARARVYGGSPRL